MTDQELLERMTARAFKLLAAKPRSEAELRGRLLEKKWAEPAAMATTAEAVITRLKELRYLDDRLFAYDFARSRTGTRPIGKTRVARDLARKQVPSEIAAEALELVFDGNEEDALIDKAIARRLRVRPKPSTREESKKLFDHLLRLGFSYELVIRKVRAIGQTELDETEE